MKNSTTLATIGLKLADLEKMVTPSGYINLTMEISDKQNEYGNNISLWQSQTKEQRDAKAFKSYAGNGKVLWTSSSDVYKAVKV